MRYYFVDRISVQAQNSAKGCMTYQLARFCKHRHNITQVTVRYSLIKADTDIAIFIFSEVDA